MYQPSIECLATVPRERCSVVLRDAELHAKMPIFRARRLLRLRVRDGDHAGVAHQLQRNLVAEHRLRDTHPHLFDAYLYELTVSALLGERALAGRVIL